jgi:tetratricopeptide (TPR) repeat protein
VAGILLAESPRAPLREVDADAWIDGAEQKLYAARTGTGGADLAAATDLLQRVLASNPSNYGAQKIAVRVLLLERKWEDALEAAVKLNRRMPDDIEAYGLLVEAHLGLRQRKDAEGAAQWMLDLRSDHPLSLWRAAGVREAYGEWDGALRFLKDAYARTASGQTLERALIAAQMSRVSLRAGRAEQAEKLSAEARRLAPLSPEVCEILETAKGELR